MIKKIDFDYSPKTKPMSHQYEAIEYIKDNQNIALFDEQGLGKSKTVIDALCSNIGNKIIDGALIICKKSLIYMWEEEIRKHSNLFPVILSGAKNKRGRSFLTFGHFYIVNYETLIQDLELINLILRCRKFAIVLDESHKIKNPQTRVTQAILSLREFGKKRIIITGTPIANKPEDIWSQFYFLDNGDLLGANYQEFKNRYSIDLKGEDLVIHQTQMAELRRLIENVSIRRTKEILELPEKKFIDVKIELSEKQREIYETAKQELYYEISNLEEAMVVQEIENYLVKLLRLIQITSNPGLIITDYDETPSKFIKLDELVNEIIEDKEKVIIWTSFRGNIRNLRRRYDDHGALMLFGDISIIDRNTIVHKFLENPDKKVLIANPAAAKEGLTLTSSNNAIYLDRNFKMDDYLQSQDRIHRIGQSKKCNIIKIIANKTIDEYIDEILEKKELIAKYILGDSDNLATINEPLTREYLLEILG